ncbi:unnamed protein product [Meloidogyne enterolobii]|uniref:Uncharacterized protein n=1 Tax=Meloidogyne enterolobii TaxID=390850 RepID=A0ACB0YS24_MELEN
MRELTMRMMRTMKLDDDDSWSDKNNVGSLSSSSESYVNLNNDKNDDSFKTARMSTPKKKANTIPKMSKNSLTRLGLELSSDEEKKKRRKREKVRKKKMKMGKKKKMVIIVMNLLKRLRI